MPASSWPRALPGPFQQVLALLLLLTGFAAPAALHASVLAQGRVITSDGRPVEGAEVSLVGTLTRVVTGPDGRFAFPSLAPGRHVVRVRHERHAPFEQSMEVRDGEPASWTFTLAERGAEPVRDLPRRRELLHTELSEAFKLAVEQREWPQSASVVTRDAFADRAAFDPRESVRGLAGVVALPDDGRGALDLVFRGQTTLEASATMRDDESEPAGLTRDLASLERIEFLRGPGSAIDGASGSRGGSVVTVGKRPRLEPAGEWRLLADGWGRVRTTLDRAATFGQSRATYRLTTAFDRLSGHRDGTRGGDGLAIAPVADVPLGELTHLLVRGEYAHRSFRDDPGLPLSAASLAVPRGRFLGERANPDVESESGAAQVELTHFLEGDVQLRQSVRYVAGSTRGRRVRLTGLTAGGLVTRESRESSERAQSFASQSEAIAKVRSGRLSHLLIAGVRYEQAARAHDDGIDSLASVPLAEPSGDRAPVIGGARQGGRQPLTQWSVYAQDLMQPHGRWKVLWSVRHDWTRIDNDRHAVAAGSLVKTSAHERTSLEATTPRAGIVFQPTRGGRVFVSAARSFHPSPGATERGDAPGVLRETGTQIEAGWKQESADAAFAWTASIHSFTQRDVRALRPPGTGTGATWRIGAQRSTGLEWHAAGTLGHDLRVMLGYAYTNARITGPGETTAAVGTRLPMSPRHHATAWIVYRVPRGRMAGLDLGAGLLSQSERSSALVGGPELPSFHELELMLGYGRRRWQAQVQVLNLNDARAFDAMPGERLVPREPRSVRTSALVRF